MREEWQINPLAPDRSFMIHGSHGRNNPPGAEGLIDKTNFLFTNKSTGRLNAGRRS